MGRRRRRRRGGGREAGRPDVARDEETMERLLLAPSPEATDPPRSLDPLQFAYREKTGVEDAIIFLLHPISLTSPGNQVFQWCCEDLHSWTWTSEEVVQL
ncbi:hypothetical protein L3Q82_012734 [Scortum barcoo]|uniref:Uncharacterized protein n=1 Tax=Scortum barcoo TaxID=214431 RepID=A0ACB8W3S5_9TELE|nr:hypothetical protein L3Q82_012734 [Scortum barcoo]